MIGDTEEHAKNKQEFMTWSIAGDMIMELIIADQLLIKCF